MIKWKVPITGDCGECGRLEEVPSAAEIETVDGSLCLGLCLLCGLPVLHGKDKALFDGFEGEHEDCSKAAFPGSG